MTEEIKWYHKKRVVFPALILFFPIGAFLLYQTKALEKKTKLWIIGGYLFLIIIAANSGSKDSTVSEKDNNGKSEIKKAETPKIKLSAKEELTNLLNGIKDFNSGKSNSTIEQIVADDFIFKTYATALKGYDENKLTNEEKALYLKLKRRLIELQVEGYPKLRKAWVAAIKEKLWLENIKVSISGKKNKTITFTGGYFADNKNKQNTQNELYDMFIKLRFNRSEYKWYEYDNEYTYYEISSPKDNEIL